MISGALKHTQRVSASNSPTFLAKSNSSSSQEEGEEALILTTNGDIDKIDKSADDDVEALGDQPLQLLDLRLLPEEWLFQARVCAPRILFYFATAPIGKN